MIENSSIVNEARTEINKQGGYIKSIQKVRAATRENLMVFCDPITEGRIIPLLTQAGWCLHNTKNNPQNSILSQTMPSRVLSWFQDPPMQLITEEPNGHEDQERLVMVIPKPVRQEIIELVEKNLGFTMKKDMMFGFTVFDKQE